ncbi:MAG: glycosyltransferase family 2 protein [Armatimonadota bacterium]|nr:glycosyltransferase family 2 protein [Armatimonadota bacterium]
MTAPRQPTVRHLVLGAVAAVWLAVVVQGITYRDALWFRYYVVNVAWLQDVFLALGTLSAVILLVGRVRARLPVAAWQSLPPVSIVIPAKNEVRVIEGVVRDACAQRYAGGIEVVVVDDRSTDGTGELLERLQAELPVTVVRTRPGSFGKAGALQVGVAASRGSVLAVFDADARMAPDVIATMVPLLAAPRVAAVQGRRLVYNAGRNSLTRFQDDEYRVFQTLMQGARQVLGGFVCLAGNGLLVKREALDAVGGWNPDALTEDIDLAVRLHLGGWEIRYCYDAQIWEEAVVTLRDLLRQRERWFEGALQCLGEYLPRILRSRLPLVRKVDMLFFLSGSLIGALAALTGYAYALVGALLEAVVYIQLPGTLIAWASAALTVAMLAAVTTEVGYHPLRLVGVLGRWTLFSLHTLVIVPLAIWRYVHGALTGARDWRKTSHEGGVG